MAIDKAIDSTAFDSKLTSVADAIRSKSGKTSTMTLNQMPQEISAQKSFGYFGNSVASIGSVAGVSRGDTWSIFSNSVSDTSISVNNGVVDVSGSLLMPFLGTYWYCLIYGVKSK